MPWLSLRARLTLLTGFLTATALLGYALIVYFLLEVKLETEIDTQLAERATLLVQDIPPSPTAIPVPPLLEEFDVPDLYAAVVGLGGEVYAVSANLPAQGIPVPQAVLRQVGAEEGRGLYVTLTVQSGEQLRLYLLPLAGANHQEVLVVAESLEPLERTLAQARTILIGTGGGILLAALGSTALLTGRALEPLAQVTAVAGRVARTGQYEERVPLPRRQDEVHQLTLTINELIATVQRSLSTQRRFLADTSHELRSPLTVLLANLNLLQRPLEAEEQALCLEEALAEAQRMRRLVSDLLLLAQSDAAQVVALQEVELPLLVEQVIASVARQAPEYPITLHATHPCWVLGDPERLMQLLRNLLENATAHTPAGTPIEVSLSCDEMLARLQVRDSGPGIAAEHLPYLWDRFYRVDRARSRALGGSGLGLAIVKYLAEAHGGTVGVQSEFGGGTTFAVSFPLLPRNAAGAGRSSLLAEPREESR